MGAQTHTYIHYQLSLSLSLSHTHTHTHTHIRIGRTGRFGRSGLAINFVDGPRSKKNMLEIADHFGKTIERLDIDDPDKICLLYTSPSPRDATLSRMPSSA